MHMCIHIHIIVAAKDIKAHGAIQLHAVSSSVAISKSKFGNDNASDNNRPPVHHHGLTGHNWGTPPWTFPFPHWGKQWILPVIPQKYLQVILQKYLPVIPQKYLQVILQKYLQVIP